jgi:hypothetical protein
MITKKNILCILLATTGNVKPSEQAKVTPAQESKVEQSCEQNPICAELVNKIKNAVQHVEMLYAVDMFKPFDDSWDSQVELLKNDLLETAARQDHQCACSVMDVLVKELQTNPNGSGNALFSTILLGNVKNFEKLVGLGARWDAKNYEGLTIAECIEKYAENWMNYNDNLANHDQYREQLKKQFFTVIANNSAHDKN